jgi:hypothetical protein
MGLWCQQKEYVFSTPYEKSAEVMELKHVTIILVGSEVLTVVSMKMAVF